ncbi:NAD(P)-dependent oxidoreductase [Gimesia fumaroli]|uniref:Uncharacterized protein n=1 Tax=Gimesia fumaroli TaxID=2527976 RepID=A0A518I700_9PLAN|nr:NAD(P)-dependent oxidoreductase [Gimesia fumaroli]QDV48849.1 hypothetical protein Enr17x_08630 [Gimesia fumaroli]
MKNSIDPTRVSIVGSGFLARGMVYALRNQPDLEVGRVLTRRDIESCNDFPDRELLTNSIEEAINAAEIVLECSGDPVHATHVIEQAMQAGMPVVTMNSEFHVTTGSALVNRGFLTEAEGDQPGSLAALHHEVCSMGFRPLVYGNIKGFLDHNPPRDSMEEWARRQGISLSQVVSFTDGTKLQIEQALIANGLQTKIAQPGLLGPRCKEISAGGDQLAEAAKQLGHPVSDYVLADGVKLPAGVFITAQHDPEQQSYLEYLKLGAGPYYTLVRNYHLCHLEIMKTIRGVMTGDDPLLNNSSQPTVGVAAISKCPLQPGTVIERGIGSFEVRGSAVPITEYPNHIPIGLLQGARIRRHIAPGEILMLEDVELPETRAFGLYRNILAQAVASVSEAAPR